MLHSATVQWNSLLLPSDGPILNYKVYLYGGSERLLSVSNVDSHLLSYEFNGLMSDTNYKTRVLAVNKYGEGNESTLISFTTLQSIREYCTKSMT